MTPKAVVAQTLAALGHRPFVIPGRGNKLASFVMQRVLPRRMRSPSWDVCCAGCMGRKANVRHVSP